MKEYEGCQKRYHEVKVLKNYKFQDNDATNYGKLVHTAAEEYIGEGKPIPPEFAFMQDILDALIKKPTAGSVPPNWRVYLDKLPTDPWGRPYQYIFPGVKGEVDVFSLGADGQAGGEGKNADIGSWQ